MVVVVVGRSAAAVASQLGLLLTHSMVHKWAHYEHSVATDCSVSAIVVVSYFGLVPDTLVVVDYTVGMLHRFDLVAIAAADNSVLVGLVEPVAEPVGHYWCDDDPVVDFEEC